VDPSYADRGEARGALLGRLAREWQAGAGKPAVKAWQVRVERDGAEVGEDREVEGPGGARVAVRSLYRLRWDGARWVFTAGL
jgi:hypothetical protein